MARTLILGGCGYLGSRLYFHLGGDKRVDSVDLEWRGKPEGIVNAKRDYRGLTKAELEPYDVVILLAGHSTVPACDKEPRAAFENNVSGFIRLCGKLRPDQKFIYASSAVVAAGVTANPTTYDLTKQWIEEWARQHMPNSWGLRFGTVGGPSPNIFLGTMVNGMTHSAMTKGIIDVRNPKVRRPILGITDLCRAFDTLIHGDVPPGVHNLCSVNSSVEEVAETVSDVTNCAYRVLDSSPTYDFWMENADWFTPLDDLEEMVFGIVSANGKEWKKAA